MSQEGAPSKGFGVGTYLRVLCQPGEPSLACASNLARPARSVPRSSMPDESNCRCLAGAELPEGMGRSRRELWTREGMDQVLLRMLLRLNTCNAVHMAAMHVVYAHLVPCCRRVKIKLLCRAVCVRYVRTGGHSREGHGWDAGGGRRPQCVVFTGA